MKQFKYSKKDGDIVVHFLNKLYPEKFFLIGSVQINGGSNTDIDILMIPAERNGTSMDIFPIDVAENLKAKKWKYTDWGSIFFYDSLFGNIDLFSSEKKCFKKNKKIKGGLGYSFGGYITNHFYEKAQKIVKKLKKLKII